MRVLMLTPDEGHLDRRIAQEAASLATRRSWQVDIYPVADPGLRYQDTLAPGVRLLSSPVPTRPITGRRRALRKLRRFAVRASPPAARLIEALRYRTSDRSRKLADANAGHLLGLPAYDLVVAHDVPVFELAGRLRTAWSCPVVCDLHEVFPEQDEHFTTATARGYWRKTEAAGLRMADGIIYVNSAVADYVRDTHAPTAPGVVVHNAVPFIERTALGTASLRDYYPIPQGARIMLFAGSLLPMKNLEILIEGFERAALDGWVLALLGQGSLQETLQRMVDRAGLQGRVFLGRRAPESDLIQLVASADIGLLPYIGSGFNNLIATPNKLFEYIQARVPIATSRLPMIEQIVTANGNGGFVDYVSPASTASGLRDFVELTLPEVTEDRTEAAAVQFSWENEEGRLLALFDSVIGSRPG